jgi:hypothetical protein
MDKTSACCLWARRQPTDTCQCQRETRSTYKKTLGEHKVQGSGGCPLDSLLTYKARMSLVTALACDANGATVHESGAAVTLLLSSCFSPQRPSCVQ